MLRVRWFKILNDLFSNLTRTLLIVVSIAVGLFAVGTIVSTRSILSTEMARSFAAIHPSNGTIRTIEPFDEEFIQSVRRMPGVAEADARRAVATRIEVAPGEWLNLIVFAVPDYDSIRINQIKPQTGAWPPPDRQILVERAALPLLKAQVGDTLTLELPDGKTRQLKIAGTAHDPAQMPANLDVSPYAYVSFETIEWFGQPYGFNELYLVAEQGQDKELVQQVVNQVKNKAETSGLTIPLSLAAEPGQMPLDDILQAVLLLMSALGLLSLFLSGFLVINTVSSILAQQRRQIGVMKAIGAGSLQIMGMYLWMVMAYGLFALAIAAPLSVVGARSLSNLMASMFNFDLLRLDIPPVSFILQAGVGLLAPVLASLVPFLSNLRVSAAQAMSNFSTGSGRFGKGLFDRLFSGRRLWFARRLPLRSPLLSLRNTFRSQGRLILTLVTLTLGSAIFIGVFHVQASMFQTLDDMMRWMDFDMMVNFDRPYRNDRIKRIATQVEGVEETGSWIQLPVRRVRADGSESIPFYMWAVDPTSSLNRSPDIISGRWLLPEEENAVVLNAFSLKEEPDLKVGSELIFKINGREETFQVVGITLGIPFVPVVNANYEYIASITGRVGRAETALIRLEDHSPENVRRAQTQIDRAFDRANIKVTNVQTMAAERAEAGAFFNIVVSLLLIMAVLLAVVGGLGLMGTMSINVLERTREIGVLRAIGAPNQGVAQVFIAEGITIGLLSWLFGVLLATPLSRLLSTAVGEAMLGMGLSFRYSPVGVWSWLGIVILLSTLASLAPARSASRLTVREVLAYE